MKRFASQAPKSSLLRVAVATCLFIAVPYASAQSVSATLRGQVTADGAAPASGASVTATNTQTGLTRSVQTGANGNYALAGLPPGPYKVDVTAGGKTSSQVVALQVGQTATLDLGVGAVTSQTVESVTVSATRLFETKTSEVSSYVSLKQIEMLPQSSRNFLQFADTVPGVQFASNNTGATELRSGAQSANGVNVFIDGIGQKNYVLRGGVSGQDGSRGNPFPQLAIGEYKVITSNYKAEFDQLSSAAIVAVTKSGTNEFQADGFYDKTNESLRASDPFEARDGRKAPSEQEQYGAAFGGPILQDRMHFFVTYERKNFETPRRVTPGNGVTSLPPAYQGYLGNPAAPFKEDLVFGKIDWSPGDAHLFELTAKIRDETELTSIGGESSASFATAKDNKDARYDLRYQYTGSFFLNDAHITYEDAQYNPRPATSGYGQQLTNGPDRNRVVLSFGANNDYQDKGQQGYGLQDEITFNAFDWFGAHTIKTGVKYKKVEINSFESTPYNPKFSYDLFGDLTTPYYVVFGSPLPGLPDRNVKSENSQYGVYVQDDWDVTNKLQLNLGVRYDYEKTPAFLDYRTPADILAAFDRQDTNSAEAGHPAAAPGQTYADTLALGGVDISGYISNGRNRKAFKDGIQPRLGFSFDLQDDQRHVIFGGAGRAYDRNVFDYLARETSKGTYPTYNRTFNTSTSPCAPGVGDCLAFDPSYYQPGALQALVAANPSLGREFYMIKNDLKTPYSDQFSVGMRNRVLLGDTDWVTSAALSYIKSEDGIVFLLGNRWPDGTFRLPNTTWGGQPWSKGIPGYGSFFLGQNGLETRLKAVLLSAEKPYTPESGWSATLAYTYSDASENRSNVASDDETFLFDYPTVGGYGWHPSTGVAKHRLVSTVIYDGPWGVNVSAKWTLASPLYSQRYNCVDAVDTNHCFPDPAKPDTTLGFKQFDLAFQKEFALDAFTVRVRSDILNLFNNKNVDEYNTPDGSPGVPDPTFLTPRIYLQPTRTFKVSVSAGWR
ncbi:MAG: TonB-dependent receptor [Steroidobacteraceae bacterium]